MSFVIKVYNVAQIFYTLASLKMILTSGRYVCDIHKEKKKQLPIFILHKCLSMAEVAISDAYPAGKYL